AVGVILSPHASEASRERYMEEVAAASAALGPRAPEVRYAGAWHTHPLFVTAVADAATAALVTLPAARRAAAVLVFTAHSVPVAMAARSPYVAEVTASARAVAEQLGRSRWQVAYQSRSGSRRESWLEPDVNEALLEAGERLGGSIATERSGGFTIEAGADSFLTEKPWAAELCERLGVPLVGTREGERRTYVVHDGRIEPLPEGFLLLAPTDLGALAVSPLFSWRGKLRMALDLVLPCGADA